VHGRILNKDVIVDTKSDEVGELISLIKLPTGSTFNPFFAKKNIISSNSLSAKPLVSVYAGGL